MLSEFCPDICPWADIVVALRCYHCKGLDKLYRGGQFYWWKATDLSHTNDKPYHIFISNNVNFAHT
jgi:hypothetical protein